MDLIPINDIFLQTILATGDVRSKTNKNAEQYIMMLPTEKKDILLSTLYILPSPLNMLIDE